MKGPIRLVSNYTTLGRLASNKHSSLLGPFIIYEKIKCFEYGSSDRIHNASFSSYFMNGPNRLVR
jgi:hypothetical protein